MAVNGSKGVSESSSGRKHVVVLAPATQHFKYTEIPILFYISYVSTKLLLHFTLFGVPCHTRHSQFMRLGNYALKRNLNHAILGRLEVQSNENHRTTKNLGIRF